MTTQLYKEDDYTLGATTTLGSGGTLTRFFNFASEQVTTVYERRADMKDQYSSYGAGGGTSVSVALSSQFSVQKFSELDSQVEVEAMRARLIEFKGNPPAAPNKLDKGKVVPAPHQA